MRNLLTTLLIVCFCGCVFAADAKGDAKARILSALQSTDIHAQDGKPFRLEARARLIFDKPIEGTYNLIWASPHLWREEIQLPGYKQTWMRNADKQWVSRSLGYPPLRVLQLEEIFGGKLPMSFDKMEIKRPEPRQEQNLALDCAQVVIRNVANKVSSKEEFCVNVRTGTPVRRKYSSGRGEHLVVDLEDYSAFGDRQTPRTLRLLQDGKPVVEAWIDKLDTETLDDSNFLALPGIDAWPTCDDVRHPEPKYRPDPSYSPEGRKKGIQGMDTLYVLVGIDGKVAKTGVLQALEASLDNQAMNAVQSWRFRPAMCGGLAVPSEVTVEVNFRLY